MSKRNKIYQSEFPYHIYNRCNNKEYLFNTPQIFSLFMDCIKGISKRTEFRPHHFVLMQNHYHLIGSTPNANLDEFMRTFQTTFSQLVNALTGRINHIFGGRYGATVISSTAYLSNVIRYVYQNPVKAKLVQHPWQYSFSTFNLYRWESWKKKGLVPDPYLMSFPEERRFSVLQDISGSLLDNNEWDQTEKNLKRRKTGIFA
jgi:putative transposase